MKQRLCVVAVAILLGIGVVPALAGAADDQPCTSASCDSSLPVSAPTPAPVTTTTTPVASSPVVSPSVTVNPTPTVTTTTVPVSPLVITTTKVVNHTRIERIKVPVDATSTASYPAVVTPVAPATPKVAKAEVPTNELRSRSLSALDRSTSTPTANAAHGQGLLHYWPYALLVFFVIAGFVLEHDRRKAEAAKQHA